MYVWGSRTPKGGSVVNKYTARIKIIAVESGREKARPVAAGVAQTWKRTSGTCSARSPAKSSRSASMTEADAGDRPLEAYYGDIAFRSPAECTECVACACR